MNGAWSVRVLESCRGDLRETPRQALKGRGSAAACVAGARNGYSEGHPTIRGARGDGQVGESEPGIPPPSLHAVQGQPLHQIWTHLQGTLGIGL